MISQRVRDMRKGRITKMNKNVERLYKEGKCRDCSVVVTRMDFAKILGKFTKVKIQYESSTTPKTKKDSVPAVNSSTKLKKSENGMVHINRKAYNQHPVKESVNSKTPRNTKQALPVPSPRQASNILKENNRLKKGPIVKDKNSNYNQQKVNSNLKSYGIIFINPNVNNNNDVKSKTNLSELLPDINKSILPNDEWAIDYFPKSEEPKEDKVYDRIAAELEDLMYNEKASSLVDKPDSENKVDDFPSIMDILNDSTPNSSKPHDQSNTFKPNLESSDVEAMLLGKTGTETSQPESLPMDVDNSDMANLIGEVGPTDAIQDSAKNHPTNQKQGESIEKDVMLSNPSIIDETLQKGIEEQLIFDSSTKDIAEKSESKATPMDTEVVGDDKTKPTSDSIVPKTEVVTHVIFKQTIDGKCYRCVTCPKNLKYSIELNGKAVEFIGAPKFVSSLEDLQVLLQIVNESHLESLYVLH
ncbi:uncharacterized protein LOC125235464 [Leguminivora glycinivorella]|uniref:uncharacterized protein LOC125235464 n=1 Tax=Leguminivora glycinivorella TaxID=1035111 RepID=UPI0020105240|nr:uncharacterized protein LOC125235464 [Leguminivora glycinivorella]